MSPEPNDETREYDAPADTYSADAFREKIATYAKAAGGQVVEKAFILYYTLQRPETPAAAKATIVGALAYFIMPFDAIADFLPGIGFTDDLGALAAAVVTVWKYVTPDIRERARAQTERLFGSRRVIDVTPEG